MQKPILDWSIEEPTIEHVKAIFMDAVEQAWHDGHHGHPAPSLSRTYGGYRTQFSNIFRAAVKRGAKIEADGQVEWWRKNHSGDPVPTPPIRPVELPNYKEI